MLLKETAFDPTTGEYEYLWSLDEIMTAAAVIKLSAEVERSNEKEKWNALGLSNRD